MTGNTVKTHDCPKFERDILEWKLPGSVLDALLKDRSSGKNILWATEDYVRRGSGFGAEDEMRSEQVTDHLRPPIRPRVDKNATEQRRRVVQRAEIFTPSWICNKQNNLVDAAWFGWKKPESSPFNEELAVPDLEPGWAWRSTPGKVVFPKGKTWQDYVESPRLEVACGEAPYLASRYDAVSGCMIPIADRIGFLDRKLRIVTENIVPGDSLSWLEGAKRALQSVYGFDWQGDNVLLARENVLATVIETYNAVFHGEESSVPRFGEDLLLELAGIASWNIWQMDGIQFVVPGSCKPKVSTQYLLDGTSVKVYSPCPGCFRKGHARHTGIYCKIMDWKTGSKVEFASLVGGGRLKELMGGEPE